MNLHSLRVAALVSAVGIVLASAYAHAAELDLSRDRLRFHPKQTAPAYQFRVIAPNGAVHEDAFMANEAIRLSGNQIPGGWVDGIYNYEITPITGMNVRSAAQAGGSSMTGPGVGAESGTFRIQNGAVYLQTDPAESSVTSKKASTSLTNSLATVVPLDQVTADDLIVQGSACVGLDCVNGESFGFDTLRLKENNTRIKFDDTSTSAGFAANDWTLVANDSASGGQNKFSIEDTTGGKTPFTVTAGAPTNSLFVASNGKLGLRTSTPVLDVHAVTSDTPAMRYEQTSAGGFTAQTWDVAGNEANFFVRDVTGGSKLPFRIRPGAATSSLDIAASGNVGIGTASPGQALDVARSGDATIRISNTSTTTTFTNEWDIKNNSATGRLTLTDDSTGTRVPVKFAPNANDNLLRVGVLASNTVDINGNLYVTGTITPDYVFEKDFSLPSIKEHGEQMWANRHLPKMSPAKVNEEGKGVINVGERAQGMLEELEYAHIYIEQLHGNLTALQQEMAEKDDELAQMRQEIAAIKASLEKR